jgi:hypothetical protein
MVMSKVPFSKLALLREMLGFSLPAQTLSAIFRTP